MGYSYGVHNFYAREKNHPLTKAMVDHNHDRIEAIDQGKVDNEIHREVLEGTRALEDKGGDGRNCRMGEDLVCLANCTSRNTFLDVGRKARPPVILGKEGNGAKVTIMAAFEGTTGGGDQIVVGQCRDIDKSCNRVVCHQRSNPQLLTC